MPFDVQAVAILNENQKLSAVNFAFENSRGLNDGKIDFFEKQARVGNVIVAEQIDKEKGKGYGKDIAAHRYDKGISCKNTKLKRNWKNQMIKSVFLQRKTE
jgi:hypothetical protein